MDLSGVVDTHDLLSLSQTFSVPRGLESSLFAPSAAEPSITFTPTLAGVLVLRSDPKLTLLISPNILPLATLGSSFLELEVVLVVDAVAIEEVAGDDAPSLLFADVEFAGRDFRKLTFVKLTESVFAEDAADPTDLPRTKEVGPGKD